MENQDKLHLCMSGFGLVHFVRESQGNLSWLAHPDPTSTQKKTNLRAREYCPGHPQLGLEHLQG